MYEVIELNHSVSNIALRANREMVVSMLRAQMRNHIADRIAQISTTEHPQDFGTTFRCEVIVADQNEFFKRVREEALRLQPFLFTGGVNEQVA